MCAVARTRNLVLWPSFPYPVVCSPQPAPGSASPIFEVPWCGGCVLWRCQRQIIQIFENDSRASVPKGGTIFSKAAADGTKKKRYQKKYILVWHYCLLFFCTVRSGFIKNCTALWYGPSRRVGIRNYAFKPDQNAHFGLALGSAFFAPSEAALEKIVPPLGTDAAAETA